MFLLSNVFSTSALLVLLFQKQMEKVEIRLFVLLTTVIQNCFVLFFLLKPETPFLACCRLYGFKWGLFNLTYLICVIIL